MSKMRVSTESKMRASSLNGMPKMVMGGLGAAMAVAITNPLDVTKTRMQLQNELRPHKHQRIYKGFIDCGLQNWRTHGVRGIQRGLSACVCREFSMNFFRIGAYEPILNYVYPTATADSPPPIPVRMAVASTAGALGAAVSNPFDLLKVRMHAHGALDTTQHSYPSFRGAFQQIVQDEGFRGLFKGLNTNIARLMVGALPQMPSYLAMKKFGKEKGFKDGALLHLCCALSSAVLVVAIMNPWDVMRTRLYNQPFDGTKGLYYKGGFDCALKIFQTESIFGFYKGAMSGYIRLGPHIALTFVFLEQLKKLIPNSER